jgi:YesN/AraC family two-component response regulator
VLIQNSYNKTMKNLTTIFKSLASDKSVLIVEDNHQILEQLSRLLEKFFLEVYTATNVIQALEIYNNVSENKSIVVITDINLGAKSGIDLTCALKHLHPEQKVIAVSGTEDRNVFIESIRCGIDGFVLKPIKNEELFTSLIGVLKKIDYDNELKENRKLLDDSREYALSLLAEQEQFLKNAIHEIHTPLAVIITNIDLLRLDGLEGESLNAIEAGARIIQNSYEDMTYLMKKNRIHDEVSKMDILAFVKERINYFHCIASVNDLSIALRVSQPSFPTMSFSQLKLSRIVDNTLSNAIKYAKRPSEIGVTVGMQKGCIFFEVRNQGAVIADKKKIFERYYRESQQKGGYGLGLHIVAEICKEENVTIEVASDKIRGTSFRYIFENATQLQH